MRGDIVILSFLLCSVLVLVGLFVSSWMFVILIFVRIVMVVLYLWVLMGKLRWV